MFQIYLNSTKLSRSLRETVCGYEKSGRILQSVDKLDAKDLIATGQLIYAYTRYFYVVRGV